MTPSVEAHRLAPGEEQFARQLRGLAKDVDFPLFVPRWVPGGLVPRVPLVLPSGVRIAYVPGADILQRKATPTDAAQLPPRAEAVQMGQVKGWYPAGVKKSDGTGSNNNLGLLRDGAWIGLSSFVLERNALVQIAASLEPVKGGHPPLPDPAPLGLADLRRRVPFPIFVPTEVSAGLVPEPPVGGEEPTSFVRISYHTKDGSAGLRVTIGPAGSGLAADPRKKGQ